MCQSLAKLKTLQTFIDTENSENTGFTTQVKLSLLPTQEAFSITSGSSSPCLSWCGHGRAKHMYSSSACPKLAATELESCWFWHLNLQFSYRKGHFITEKITNCTHMPRKQIQKLRTYFLGPVIGIGRFKRMFGIRRPDHLDQLESQEFRRHFQCICGFFIVPYVLLFNQL